MCVVLDSHVSYEVHVIVLDFDALPMVSVRDFQSRGASSLRLGEGHGDIRLHTLHFDPGGEVGTHPAGFDQIFFVLKGRAWAEGDGGRVDLDAGQGVYFASGEHHAKGSATGALTIVLQMSELKLEVTS
jgi:quercetin dioxygenase-like cupin family protein